jgi:DNA-binding CsgD family transcriptional regulator
MTRTWEELSAERKTLARTRGQNIIQLRAEGKTYTDIGKIIGLSGSRCRDLERRHIRTSTFTKITRS